MSADNLIWEVSIDHNMMSYIKKVQSKPRPHVSVNLLLGGWPPSCATAPSSSPCVRAHDNHEKIPGHWPGEKKFNAVSHKPTHAPIQSVLESWRPVGCHSLPQRNRSMEGKYLFSFRLKVRGQNLTYWESNPRRIYSDFVSARFFPEEECWTDIQSVSTFWRRTQIYSAVEVLLTDLNKLQCSCRSINFEILYIPLNACYKL